MAISALIVDDEKSGRENLRGLLQSYCLQVKVVAEASSVKTAISLIQEYRPQLVFLDIEMPGGDGFQLLEHFDNFPFEVIFVTAYDSYAIKAIRFSASDYILKPINLAELLNAVGSVVKRINDKNESSRIRHLYQNTLHPANPKIGLPTGDNIEFVEVTRIIRCQGESNYTHLYFTNRKPLLVAKTLIEFEELLTEYGFLRVHKTHLVNLNQIQLFSRKDGGILQLTNGDEIAVSRRRKDFVMEQLKSIVRFS